MIKHLGSLIASVLVMLCFAEHITSAEVVFIQVNHGTGNSGQGVTFQGKGGCFVVTPKHVTSGASEITVIGKPGINRIKTIAERIMEVDDFAIYKLKDPKGLKGLCSKWDIVSELDSKVSLDSEGILVRVLENSTTQAMDVKICARSGDKHKYIIEPTKESNKIQKTMSGSVVKIGGVTAGMLTEVRPEVNKGVVYRQDRLTELLDFLLEPRDTLGEDALSDNSVRLCSIVLTVGTVISGAAALIFNERAKDEYKKVPPTVSEEKVITWGNYRKFQTRAYWYGWTAVHLGLSTLPFLFDWTDKGPRVGKWPLAGFFFLSSAVFTTCGIISGNKANDAQDKLKTEYSTISEDRVTYWGKYQKYKERRGILYLNAATDLATTIGILLWYNRNDERLQAHLDSQKSIKLSLDFGVENWNSAPQIGITLRKSF